jgi:hypothetical protein
MVPDLDAGKEGVHVYVQDVTIGVIAIMLTGAAGQVGAAPHIGWP